jgi:hypothetical protein
VEVPPPGTSRLFKKLWRARYLRRAIHVGKEERLTAKQRIASLEQVQRMIEDLIKKAPDSNAAKNLCSSYLCEPELLPTADALDKEVRLEASCLKELGWSMEHIKNALPLIPRILNGSRVTAIEALAGIRDHLKIFAGLEGTRWWHDLERWMEVAKSRAAGIKRPLYLDPAHSGLSRGRRTPR